MATWVSPELRNASSPISVIPSKSNDVNALHFWKHSSGISCIVCGKFIVVRLIQPLKTLHPICLRSSGSVTVVRSLHSINALLPMVFTVSGRVTEVSGAFLNASLAIEVTVYSCFDLGSVTFSGITTSPVAFLNSLSSTVPSGSISYLASPTLNSEAA